MKEKSFIKVCIFLKFRRHFEISRADADFQRFRFHDVSECFITAGNYKHMRAERKYLYNKQNASLHGAFLYKWLSEDKGDKNKRS